MPTPDPQFWPDMLLLVAAIVLICVLFIDPGPQPRPGGGRGSFNEF